MLRIFWHGMASSSKRIKLNIQYFHWVLFLLVIRLNLADISTFIFFPCRTRSRDTHFWTHSPTKPQTARPDMVWIDSPIYRPSSSEVTMCLPCDAAPPECSNMTGLMFHYTLCLKAFPCVVLFVILQIDFFLSLSISLSLPLFLLPRGVLANQGWGSLSL